MQKILGHLPLASARKLAKAGFQIANHLKFSDQLQIENTSRHNINIEDNFRQRMTFFSHCLRLNCLKILVSRFHDIMFPQQ